MTYMIFCDPPNFVVAFAFYQDPGLFGKRAHALFWTLSWYSIGAVFCILLSGTDRRWYGLATCGPLTTARPSNPGKDYTCQTPEMFIPVAP